MTVQTSINLNAGATSTHCTVEDQSGNALSPSFIAWAPMTDVSVTSDATGFFFTAAPSAATETQTTQATYTGPGASGPVVGPTLSINITATVSVTALQYDFA
jgi:hypothetical protein